MGSIQPSNPSSTEATEQFLERLAGPLLDRCRVGRPALGLAFYEGDQLDPSWPRELDTWGRDRGLFVDHVSLGDLGESPVRRILARQRVEDHLLSLEIRPEDLPIPGLGEPSRVVDLNIHRDTFRDEGLVLLVWVPREYARRFVDLAANLADYATVSLEVPPLSGTDGPTPEASEPPAAGARHNLPIGSLGRQFVGREREIAQIREALAASGRTSVTDPLALEGWGGIGKTRLAIEYAWRHIDEYDWVFFVRADTPQALEAGLAGFAGEEWLGLPEASETAEAARARAVLSWLEAHSRWLLIVDSADDEATAESISATVLPRAGRGHVILTTRFRRWGGEVRALSLSSLPQRDAVSMLLHTTEGDRRPTADDPEVAAELADAVDGLPLALEQIAAWVRVRHASLSDALSAITSEDDRLLRWYDPREMRYPRPVAAVWERALEELDSAQCFLVRFFAWLAPDPVPDFLARAVDRVWSTEGTGSTDFLGVARSLADRSVLEKRRDRSFQLHRLALELERRRTPADERPLWDRRVAAVLEDVRPEDARDARNWPRLSLLEPHARELFRRTEGHTAPEPLSGDEKTFLRSLSDLLDAFGRFALALAQYDDAERLLRRALATAERTLVKDDPKLAVYVNNLAQSLRETNQLDEAERLMRRALSIGEQTLGDNHPSVASQLNNLAALLWETNRLDEAEPLMRRALAVDEQARGDNHPSDAIRLNNRAQLLQGTNRLDEAEPLMRRALEIEEQARGDNHPNVAVYLGNLAALLHDTNRFDEAERLLRRAVATEEQARGHNHPDVAIQLNNLAVLLQDTNRRDEAERLMRRALTIAQASLGGEHPRTQQVADNYEGLLRALGRSEAEIQAAVHGITK